MAGFGSYLSKGGELVGEVLGFGLGLVIGVTIDVEDLKIGEGLVGEIFKKAGEILFFIKGGDDDGEEGFVFIAHGIELYINESNSGVRQSG